MGDIMPERPSEAPSHTNPTAEELAQAYAESRHRVALREQLDAAERPWRLRNQANDLLAAARDTIDKALELDDETAEPIVEEYTARAAALCEMAVEKCLARLRAERGAS
ncbi:MAG: hypothetical protein ACRDPQ_03565 [Nocardioidaceae bacterium]